MLLLCNSPSNCKQDILSYVCLLPHLEGSGNVLLITGLEEGLVMQCSVFENEWKKWLSCVSYSIVAFFPGSFSLTVL